MRNLTIELINQPGGLAHLGETLGAAGISIEGGGVFSTGDYALAQFLVHDGTEARRALEAAGITVLADRPVIVLRLDQEKPGQLGKAARRMAESGVNIDVQYSDHTNQLILVVDDCAAAEQVASIWKLESSAT